MKKDIFAKKMEDPFHLILNGESQKLHSLLEKGLNPNLRDARDESLISYAIKDRDLETLKLLLEFGSNPNWLEVGDKYPLLIAVEKEDPELVQILLNFGADPYLLNEKRETAFFKGQFVKEKEIKEILDEYSKEYLKKKYQLKELQEIAQQVGIKGKKKEEIAEKLVELYIQNLRDYRLFSQIFLF